MPTTLMPRCAACLSAGATAPGSLPAMMIASAFCCTAALMNEICEDADASVGPVILFEPPSSLSASSMPECSNSSYGLPSCFGIDTVLRPCLIGADGFASPEPELLELELELLLLLLLEPDDADCSSLVSPHAASTAATATRPTAASQARSARRQTELMTLPP